jgi:hypothetical protein
MHLPLPQFLAGRIRGASASPHAVAQAAGVSGQCVRRILANRPYREWSTIATALVHLDLDLVAHDGHEATVIVSSFRTAVNTGAAIGFPPPTGADDALLGLIAWRCRCRGINANRLHCETGIPYACARRLVAGQAMRVSISLQRLLSALGIALFAIDERGRSWPLRLHRADPQLGDHRRLTHLQRLRQWRQRQPSRPRRHGGRLGIDKGHVLELRQHYGLSYAEIGRLAGVSRHRIRQIVQMLLAVPHAAQAQAQAQA